MQIWLNLGSRACLSSSCQLTNTFRLSAFAEGLEKVDESPFVTMRELSVGLDPGNGTFFRSRVSNRSREQAFFPPVTGR
jgi:hypothetical protein